VLSVVVGACHEPVNTLFTSMPVSTTHVKFVNQLQETEELNIMRYNYLYNGGGVAVGDINQDGLVDIYFSGNMVGNKLFLNKGNFEFEDITELAGVSANDGWSSGVTMADVNGDGLLDIYVCRSVYDNYKQRKNLLYINNGDLTFTDKAELFGIDDSGYSTQASFFDYDKDGDLDMYLLNHSLSQYAGFNKITATLKNTKNPLFGDKLFNYQDGHFVDVTKTSGIKANVLGFGLGVAISDLNDDGWSDIYICNDFNEQDYLYINDQNGGFREELESYIDHVSLNSMGSDIADINNDGYMDIISLDMLPESNYRQKMVSGPDNYDKFSLLEKFGFYNQSMRNMLQLNHGGDYGFAEVGQLSGISNTDWSWAALAADFDNDGLKDVFITNGYRRNFTDMDFINYLADETIKGKQAKKEKSLMEFVEKMPPVDIPNSIFRNNGDLTFDSKIQEWGMGKNSKSNGAAYADLDNDGDLDLIINNVDDNAAIYRNNSETLSQNHFVRIKLVGHKGNASGIGAKVSVKAGESNISQEVMPTRGFQSSVDHILTIGLGSIKNIDTLSITWIDGTTHVMTGVDVDTTLVLHQKDAVENLKQRSKEMPLFVVAAPIAGLNYTHQENPFIDFKSESLLPHMLSTQGPKLAIGDVNADGLDDMYIGGAKGYAGQLFVQKVDGSFELNAAFEKDVASEDIDALFFDADGDQDLDLYVVSGGNDFSKSDLKLQDRLYFNDGKGNFAKEQALPQMLTSGSCVISNDMDGDGDLDLFVGGRLVPDNYPVAPRSYLLENDGKGKFKDVTEKFSNELLNPGMVTDAVWSDFDLDGKKDLILVGEWMPVSFFKNTGEAFLNVSNNLGIVDSDGWWNSIVAHDMDKDGDDDYIVGNMGTNSQIKASADQPATLVYKDFDSDGSIDPILNYYIGNESYPAFSKDDLLSRMVFLKKRYVSYDDYANEKIEDVFSPAELKGAITLAAKTMKTSYIENLGNGSLDMNSLPLRAQVAPVYGILPGDFNHDGFEDFILTGNFYGSRIKFGKYDANSGTLMLGKPDGGFEYATKQVSGLNINGEVRDMAFLSNKGDSLIVLVLNNAPIQIWKMNDEKHPGVQLVLAGNGENERK